jgi:hypothetical protein
MKWLSGIQEKMANVPAQYLVLDEPVNPGETVIGRLPDDVLRLHGLHVQMAHELNVRIEKHMITHADGSATLAECRKFHAEVDSERSEIDVIQSLVWMSVRAELDVTDDELALRTDGDVVRIEKSRIGIDAFTELIDFLSAIGPRIRV